MRSKAEHRGDALRQLESLGRVSVPNAAVLMGIHPYTLREYIDRGFVETLKIGQRHWILADEIEHYRAHGKRTPELAPETSEAKTEPNKPQVPFSQTAAGRLLGGDSHA